ncbi:cupin domain-containing protein [Microbacterium sp. Root180]|uniref:cupin domain-containing protein n=1 Tax=Microbacterium sp. Root180 TaxID=1736483 RepID=UPI0006FA6BE5|nr:cupin domain-containing protein [Microbacterium sp. Root180]KRB38470.1 cupin [Microbacterium sp. Root180]
MSGLAAGAGTDAASLDLALAPVPAEQVVDGSPRAGSVELGEIGGIEIGVWEHTPGVSTDVEADEVFVVLSGAATVSFDDPALPDLELRPGSVARLTAGMRTTWTIRETLRKIYLAP